MSPAILSAFVLLAAVHIGLMLSHRHPWDTATKVLLAPLLALGVALADGSWLLVAALVFYAVGDFFMDFERTLRPGMVSFAAGHILLIALFLNDGSRPAWWIFAALYAVSAASVTWLWSGLTQQLRPAVLGYSMILATMAALALGFSPLSGAGALVFMASDSLIASRLASRIRDSAVAELAVIVSYLAAIALIASGALG
jgi:uncharacterized membrane protein YhhN